MKQVFYKMHALGNDYVFFDCFDLPISSPNELAVRLCNRRTGIGGDGIVILEKSTAVFVDSEGNGKSLAHAKMRIFNADGSEAELCGNGLRCAAKFLWDIRKIRDGALNVETVCGVKKLYPMICDGSENGEMKTIRAEMGKAAFDVKSIPVTLPPDDRGEVALRTVTIGGTQLKITCVSLGNPHCVVFFHEESQAFEQFEFLAERLGNAPFFPNRANVEFVNVKNKNAIYVRVYERGCGETYACGTGACAAVAAAVKNGYMRLNEEILVKMRGGTLSVKLTEENTFLTGEAALSFVGIVDL